MDNLQKHVHQKCSAFTDEHFEYEENEVTISLNSKEAYVVMKAIEDQQRFLNPLVPIGE